MGGSTAGTAGSTAIPEDAEGEAPQPAKKNNARKKNAKRRKAESEAIAKEAQQLNEQKKVRAVCACVAGSHPAAVLTYVWVARQRGHVPCQLY